MINHETLINILDSVYEQTNVKYQVEKDYNNDKKFTITIIYPELHISNEDNDELFLENFVIKINGTLAIKDNQVFYSKFNNIGAYNLSPTEEMIIAGYAHSHVSGLTSHTICLGETTLKKAFDDSRIHLNEDKLYDFFTLLDVMVHHESIDGGPYVYIENVHDAQHSSNDAYKYISENDYLFFKEDHCVSETLGQYDLGGAPHIFLEYLKDEYNNNTLSDEHKKVAEYIHHLIKCVIDDTDFMFNSYVYYYIEDGSSFDKIIYSSKYKELLSLCEYIVQEYINNNTPFIDVMNYIEDFYKVNNNVNITDIKEVDCGSYCRVLVNGEVYDEDDLFDLETVYGRLEDYTSINNETDYDYTINYINSLSFFIDGNLYEGNAKPVTQTQGIIFDIYEHIENTYKIYGRYTVQQTIKNIAERKQSYHNIVVRNSEHYLASASNSIGQISLR